MLELNAGDTSLRSLRHSCPETYKDGKVFIVHTRRKIGPTVNKATVLSFKVLRRLEYRAPRYLCSQIFGKFP